MLFLERKNSMKAIMKKITTVITAICLLVMTACSPTILPFEGKTLPDGKAGVAYETSIATGTKDMYYDLDYDSNLPSGLILYDTGIIKGVPKESGTFNFKAVMIDLNDNEYYADFSVHIEEGELVYSGGALPDAKEGEPYSQNLATATGMDKVSYELKKGCVLPKGLTFSKDGVLSGIPEEFGEFSITVTASSTGCAPVDATFTLKIAEGEKKNESLGVIVFEDFTLPDGMVGEEYSQSIRRAYGVADISYSFRFSSGEGLPTGLKIDKTLGIISGTPKDSTEGSITFRVTASAKGYDSVTAYVTLTVYDPYVTTTRFETEYVDTIPHLSGAGYSSAPSGRGMIQMTPLCSNGAVLGYLNKPVDIVYTIYADEATTAKLTLGLGSDNGKVTYDSEMFSIDVNGTQINYGTISFEQKGNSETTYETTACTISPVINLQKGVNIITFSIKKTDKATGTYSAVGCLFDYIELTGASCDLGWRPRTANVS